ncbi:zinc finger protein 91-like isoform X1 [Macrobrachium rosenbergii]
MDETSTRNKKIEVKMEVKTESSPRTSSEESYPCNSCEMHFSSSSELEKHQKDHIKKEFECGVCGRKYVWEQNLTRHQKSAHLSGRKKQNRSHSHSSRSKLSENTEVRRPRVNSSANPLNNQAKADSKVSKNPYACDICGKVFSFKNYVSVHRRLHSNAKPYKCSICNREYRLPSSYRNHVKLHKNTNIRKRFPNPPAKDRNDKRKTVRKKVKNPLACDICGKVLNNKYYVSAHKRVHYGLKPYKCTLCKKEFRHKSNYNKHLKEEEQCGASEEKPSVSALTENLKDQAKVDGQVLQPRSNNVTSRAKSHNGLSVGKSAANLLPRNLDGKSDPNSTEPVRNSLSGKLCGKTFSRSDSVPGHMSTHAGAKPYSCTLCNMKFRVASSYKKHVIETHPNTIRGQGVERKSSFRPMKDASLSCTHCSKSLPSRQDLLRHLESHGRYSCETCDEDFALETDMVMHMKTAHDVEKKLDESGPMEDGTHDSNGNSPEGNEASQSENGCEVCRKTFPDAIALRKHKAAMHVEGKPHVCPVCQRVFKMKMTLVRHYATHRRGRLILTSRARLKQRGRLVLTSRVQLEQSSSRTFFSRCKACKVSFTSPSEYMQHRLMHFKRGPHECQGCEVVFDNPTDYAKHMKKIHKNPRPFGCDKCDKKCNHYNNLVTHMLVSHENLKVSPFHIRTSKAKVSFNNPNRKNLRQISNQTHGKENTLENNQLASEHPLTENNNLDEPSPTTSTLKPKTDIHKSPDKQESKCYACALCKREFTSYYFKKKHLTLCHEDYGGMTLRKRSQPLTMPLKFIGGFDCYLCRETFPSRYLRLKHMRTDHENTGRLWVYTCVKCKRMFVKKGSYDKHVRKCRKKRDTNCRNEDSVGDLVDVAAKLAEEQSTKAKENGISQERERNGKNKSQETDVQPELPGNENMEGSLGRVLHEDVASEGPETESQKSHKDEEVKVHKCPVCEKGFAGRDCLFKHVRMKHRISRVFFSCLHCKQVFYEKSFCEDHIKICQNMGDTNLVTEETTVKIVGPETEATDRRQNAELRERADNLRCQETENTEQELIENAVQELIENAVQANETKEHLEGSVSHDKSVHATLEEKSRPDVNSNETSGVTFETDAQKLRNENIVKVYECALCNEMFTTYYLLTEHKKTEHSVTSQMEVNDTQSSPLETEDWKQELHENKKSESQASESKDLQKRVFTEDERSVEFDFPEIAKCQEIECTEHENLSGDYETFCDDNQSVGGGRDGDDAESNSLMLTEQRGTLTSDLGDTVTKSSEVETDISGGGVDSCNNTSLEREECLISKEHISRNEMQSKTDTRDGPSKETTGQLSCECESGTSATRQTFDECKTETEAEIADRGSTALHNNFEQPNHREVDRNAVERNLHIYSQLDADRVDNSPVLPEGRKSTPEESDSRTRQTIMPKMCAFVANCSGYQLLRRSVEKNHLATPNNSPDLPRYVVVRNLNVAYASLYEAKVVDGWMKY